MRILVVCGAGASSTFVAMRLRHAAADRGIALQAFAGTEASLAVDLDAADILLVGPHLEDSLEDIRRLVFPRGTQVILLPEDVFGDLDGARTLDLVTASLQSEGAAPATPSTRGDDVTA